MQFLKCRLFVFVGWFWLFFLPFLAHADAAGSVPDQTRSISVHDRLTVIRSNIELMDQLRRQGVEVDAEGVIVRRLLEDAARLTEGRVATVETLREATGTAPTPGERREGWFSFVHVLWLVGGLAVVAALVLLFGHYFARLLAAIPAVVWEVGFYGVCLGAVAGGSLMPKGYAMGPVFPGCLGLVGCVVFSRYRHRFHLEGWMAWLFVPVWGTAAWYYGSGTVGFLTVGAVLWALGFHAAAIPGVVYLGFKNTTVIPQTTMAAGLLLAVHVGLHCAGMNPGWLTPFRDGMGFLGAIVFLLGVLILSNRWYAHKGGAQGRLRYGLSQVLALLSGVAVVYFGGVYRVEALLGIGGTFICLYLLEKYFELPWRGIGWAWAMLGGGGMLYGFALFAQVHPEWFFFMG